MPLPPLLHDRFRLPVVAAPMFLVSGPELVIAASQAGILGSFPALNRRTTDGFDEWLGQIGDTLGPDVPYGVNMIVHRTNPRLAADMEVAARHQVPVIITSLGAATEIVEAVHGWGGVVFHDVIHPYHARKAAAAGVDGIIAVAAGAGGHGGRINPIPLVNEIRSFFDGTILLSGALSTGRDVLAARAMGADLAYMGTRFIATKESMAQKGFKKMVVDSDASEIIYTPAVSGIHANFLKASLERAGLPTDPLAAGHAFTATEMSDEDEARAWRDVWSAGQGVGSIDDVPSVAELVDRLAAEYDQALGALGTA